MPGASFVLADTDAEAEELSREIRLRQVSTQTAIKFLEQLWNTDLSDHDPDGPLPAFDPLVDEELFSKGRASVRRNRDPIGIARQWRAKAEAEHLTSRELIVAVSGRHQFIGSAATVAETINRYVQDDAADGYIIGSHLTPVGLDPFVAKVVPLLQERGVFRAEYSGSTLRDHLGLRPLPGWSDRAQ
jgi:alkanesulfonate monooxygenase SsuD/methylene tetrahydromethanopterin reductase-like flavin-dependent oxidoreductase (luciferase family)